MHSCSKYILTLNPPREMVVMVAGLVDVYFSLPW